MRKLLFEDVKRNIEELGYWLINNDESDLVYKNDGLYVNVIDSCGYKYFARYKSIIKYSLSRFAKSNSYTLENISLWLKLNNKNFELCEDNSYNNAKEKLFFHCFKCENNFQTNWSDILQNRNCGVCAGLQITANTSLAYLNIKLTKEWLYSENNLNPYTVGLGSKEKVYWKCSECKYEWWATIYDRTATKYNKEYKCPSCLGRVVSDSNRLSKLFPEISMEWHPVLNNNLNPDDVSFGSHKKVWWKCKDCGHEWKTRISSRCSTNNTNCPSCSGNIVSDKNRLSILFPELIKEWNYLKNKELNPEELSYANHKKVWWVCSNCGKDWKATISSRTSKERCGCPFCADKQKESKIAFELKEYMLQNYNAETEYKIFRNPLNNYWLPFDIYVQNNIFIEIHGIQHYKYTKWFYKTQDEFKYRQYLDQIKKEYAEKNGTYIEIDLRKIKNVNEAIEYIENILQ